MHHKLNNDRQGHGHLSTSYRWL